MQIQSQADIERLMIERNVSFVFRPSVAELPDGTWVARYPAADWSVMGCCSEEARQRLHAEQLSRMRGANHSDWKVEAVVRHFAEGPVTGVYELDNAVADSVIEAGTQEALDAAVGLP
ncbi:hypothetical protein H8Z64_07185 [Mycobacterium avium subsp. hominissuis]|nr:hypothetical protein [Mycobacterium avium]MCA4734127.1 hypothetical protein [Mycobacterium avium subsp. hominissuis]MCA4742960.1 hypothetical protein [Mycobacterium avium subsp. hominissuis]MCA4764199.1 hypothetical protein [Mycobacterium avium subsp. hominissuis]